MDLVTAATSREREAKAGDCMSVCLFLRKMSRAGFELGSIDEQKEAADRIQELK
jgi:hypothetical protein